MPTVPFLRTTDFNGSSAFGFDVVVPAGYTGGGFTVTLNNIQYVLGAGSAYGAPSGFQINGIQIDGKEASTTPVGTALYAVSPPDPVSPIHAYEKGQSVRLYYTLSAPDTVLRADITGLPTSVTMAIPALVNAPTGTGAPTPPGTAGTVQLWGGNDLKPDGHPVDPGGFPGLTGWNIDISPGPTYPASPFGEVIIELFSGPDGADAIAPILPHSVGYAAGDKLSVIVACFAFGLNDGTKRLLIESLTCDFGAGGLVEVTPGECWVGIGPGNFAVGGAEIDPPCRFVNYTVSVDWEVARPFYLQDITPPTPVNPPPDSGARGIPSSVQANMAFLQAINAVASENNCGSEFPSELQVQSAMEQASRWRIGRA